jgi:hypothetical protein
MKPLSLFVLSVHESEICREDIGSTRSALGAANGAVVAVTSAEAADSPAPLKARTRNRYVVAGLNLS